MVYREWTPAQINTNKSEAICLGTSSKVRAAIVTVAGTTLLVIEEIRSLGVIIDRRLTFESHISAVVKSRYTARVVTVKPVHAITAVATDVILAASAAAACLQSSTYLIQGRNHIESIIP